MTGRTISHYKVTAELGRGGMGIVYKAEDTNLKRPVALKFLAAHLLGDKEVKARFRREAEAAAALNHPNVCHVYEISEVEGKTFIAMAFLEGEPLEKKIEAGPLKLKDALDFAIQTAKGLQAAHGKKIVHRDIKPANLMIGEDGHVTIMDFGLALLADRSKLTRLDETMGTVTYMSPEQTYGMELDHRTDVWSLGVVIYEMVTGQRPFKGHYDKAVMYSITNEEPEPMTALRTGVPMELELLVNKCLAKEADRRYQSTADMVVDLETLAEKLKSGKSTILRTGAPVGIDTPTGPIVTQLATLPTPAEAHSLSQYHVTSDPTTEGDLVVYRAEDTHLKRSVTISVLPESAHSTAKRRQRALVTALGAVCVVLAALLIALWIGTEQPDSRVTRRFAFSPENFLANVPGRAVISPNGKHVAYLAGSNQPSIWIRDLQREEPREVPGTEGAERPFWSPDSQFIGFAAGGELRKIELDGGTSITLCRLPASPLRGGTWSPDGEVVVFAVGGPSSLYQVSARGGETGLLFEGTARGLSSPHFLPLEGKVRPILFEAGLGEPDREVAIGDPETGEWTVLGRGAYPVYSASGHVLYQTNRYESGLWAMPFSVETLRPVGEAFPIAGGLGEPTLSTDGSLVATDSFSRLRQLGWRDRDGNQLELVGQPQERIQQPWLSPDQQQVVVAGSEGGSTDVWVHELARPVKTRLTFERINTVRWTPSGEGIVFSARREGNFDIFQRSADGTGEAELLVSSDGAKHPSGWTPDGKYLVYQASALQTGTDTQTGADIWYLERKAQGDGFDAHPFLETRFFEGSPRLSPDGLFVAYISNESGQNNVHVRSFPDGAGKLQISPRGGVQVRWAKDGTELFYVEGDTLMSVSISTRNGFEAGSPKPLFRYAGFGVQAATSFDVSADGQRFLLIESVGEAAEEQQAIHVIENWYEEFRDREQD